MRYFDRIPAGSIVSRVTNDTESIKEMFVSVIVTFLQAIFGIIGVYIALFSLDVKLSFASMLLLPLFFAIIFVYRRYSADFYQDIRERLSQLNAKIAESLSGMGMIQAFRQEERLSKEFDDINEGHYRAGMRNIKFDSVLLGPFIDLLYALAIVCVLGYFGFMSLGQCSRSRGHLCFHDANRPSVPTGSASDAADVYFPTGSRFSIPCI